MNFMNINAKLVIMHHYNRWFLHIGENFRMTWYTIFLFWLKNVKSSLYASFFFFHFNRNPKKGFNLSKYMINDVCVYSDFDYWFLGFWHLVTSWSETSIFFSFLVEFRKKKFYLQYPHHNLVHFIYFWPTVLCPCGVGLCLARKCYWVHPFDWWSPATSWRPQGKSRQARGRLY